MPDSRTHTPTPSLRQRLVEAADFYAARPSVNQAISVPRMREISTRECSELARLLHSAIASYDGLVEALREALPLVELAEYLDSKRYGYGPGHNPPSPGECGINVEFYDSKEGGCHAQFAAAVAKFHADDRAEDDGSAEFLTTANKIRRALEAAGITKGDQ